MNWLGIALVVLGLYFAFKVAGFVLRLAMWALVYSVSTGWHRRIWACRGRSDRRAA